MPDIGDEVEHARVFPRGPAGAIAAAAERPPAPDDPAFGAFFDSFADARVVLIRP